MSNDNLITLVVFSGLELGCLVAMIVSGAKLLRARARMNRLARTTGRIVSHEEHVASMRGAGGYGTTRAKLFRPVVRFPAPGGREIEIKHPVATSMPPAVGARVQVLFDPRDPSKAKVHSALATYLGPGVVLAATGLVLLILVAVELSILR